MRSSALLSIVSYIYCKGKRVSTNVRTHWLSNVVLYYSVAFLLKGLDLATVLPNLNCSMSDPVELVLDFLQRHRFAKAEAAFKAELLSREDDGKLLSPTENVSNWDLQLQSLSNTHKNAGVASTAGEQKLILPLERDTLGGSNSKEGGSFLEEVKSPPEKQLYIEYQPQRVFLSDNFCPVSQEFPSQEVSTAAKGESPSLLITKDHVTSPIQAVVQGASWTASCKPKEVPQNIKGSVEPSSSLSTQAKNDNYAVLISNEATHEQLQSKPPATQFHAQQQEYHRDELQKELYPYVSGPCCNIAAHISEEKANGSYSIIEGQQVVESTSRIKHCGEVSFQVHSVPSTNTLNEEAHEDSVSKIPLPLSLQNISSSDEQQRFFSPENNYSIYGSKVGKKLVWDGKNVEAVTLQPMSNGNSGATSCFNTLESHATSVHVYEEIPRLAPVRLYSIDKDMDVWEKDGLHADQNVCRKTSEPKVLKNNDGVVEDNLGSCISTDTLVDQVLSTSGSKHSILRSSSSQVVAGALSDHVPSLLNTADGWYPDEYCDSDTYEDDDDPGYHRQPIEDEEWFFAHEIDYLSDDERAKQYSDKHALKNSMQSRKADEDEGSYVEEESYFSGEEYYMLQTSKKDYYQPQLSELRRSEDEHLAFVNVHPSSRADNDPLTLLGVDHSRKTSKGQTFDAEELLQLKPQPVWEGFIGHSIEDDASFDGLVNAECGDEDNHGSVKSGGVFVSSDIADVGSELRDSLPGESSEGDEESLRDQELSTYKPTNRSFDLIKSHNNEQEGPTEVRNASMRHLEESNNEHDMVLQYYNEAWGLCKRATENELASRSMYEAKDLPKSKLMSNGRNMGLLDNSGSMFEGFSFPSPSSTEQVAMSIAESGKSPRSTRERTAQADDIDGYGSGMAGPDDTLAAWKQKSNNSSPIFCSSEDNRQKLNLSNHLNGSFQATDCHKSLEAKKHGNEESGLGCQLGTCQPSIEEEEDTLTRQEEMRMPNENDDQFEIFNLRVIHRKNRTGFEEDKDFPVLINSVVAGRYHVTEYLGSAAFSKAIQAHDLHTGMDVCMKIIKNNKDFFDQSLDEIKLLKFVNQHDPVDKYHILRLFDYFYHREHLFIVCELLRANLYEFHKFNRESGGEVYFTMPRLQSITRQCLEALEFLHRLGIIHCDLKPENILVKSYSRCEIKIIDLGSSCFQTDHLCSYVQSRSYRAPEVILGLPYDKKIDIWSLGCILAELCTGTVLFQNDSLATLLARVVSILGPIDPEVLAKGRDTRKFFTKNHMIYERNQETEQLEYLIPKRTSLSHRLPLGDHGYVEFVRYLLQSNPSKRPSATEALQHPWLSFPYEPISS